jgi:sporulation protein YlmC with PRC-barrel domain
MENRMKHASIIIFGALAFAIPRLPHAQVAGSSLLGVEATELREVAVGWSAKKQVLGKAVFNENNERIGKVDDVVIAPDKAVSYAIIGAGGFLGVAKHDVAIPVNQFRAADGKFFLDGATKQALKEMPAFEYAR